jgi:hypothetical protein
LAELAVGQAYIDSDSDGLPDNWEREHGLQPDAPDQNRLIGSQGLTALELFLAEAAKPQKQKQ